MLCTRYHFIQNMICTKKIVQIIFGFLQIVICTKNYSMSFCDTKSIATIEFLFNENIINIIYKTQKIYT